MKIRWILAAALALALAAPPVVAVAAIKNSAHDLSSSNVTYTRQGLEQHTDTNLDRICAFCHTPHQGDLTVTNAPLWNRTGMPDVTTYTYYTSATLTATATAHAAAAGSDVPLCMSCHDGASITNALKNPVAGDAKPPVYDMANIGAGSTALLLDGVNSLTNDHPVGFDYNAAEQDAAETGLYPLATAKTNGAVFYGAGANEMWCSSCHAVHEPGTFAAGTAPFLRISNNASALCLACHNK